MIDQLSNIRNILDTVYQFFSIGLIAGIVMILYGITKINSTVPAIGYFVVGIFYLLICVIALHNTNKIYTKIDEILEKK